MSEIQRKPKTPRSKAYLSFVRGHGCVSCGTGEDIQAAHVRGGNGGGMGLKPSDFRTVPLCWACHANQHQVGEKAFWAAIWMDPDEIIAGQLTTWLRRKGLVKEMIGALESVADRAT